MLKLNYKGQEISLDESCRIDLGSVKTDTLTSTGWCATHRELDDAYFKVSGNNSEVVIMKEATLEILLDWICDREGDNRGNIRINCANFHYGEPRPLRVIRCVIPFRDCIVKSVRCSKNGCYSIYDVWIEMPDLSINAEYDRIVDAMFADLEKIKEQMEVDIAFKVSRQELEMSERILKMFRGD
jgi:hypothetical protein